MKGILLSTDMHQAIREGRKTVTRRVIKPQPYIWKGVMRWVKKENVIDINMDDHSDLAIPYAPYQVGEVVYIKEAWEYRDEPREYEGEDLYTWIYYSTGDCRLINRKTCELEEEDILTADSEDNMIWRSPLFMPAWAARDFIKFTDNSPERLQEITEEESKAEGIRVIDNTTEKMFSPPNYPDIHRDIFIGLWDSINPKYPYSSNPWVWRYEFNSYMNNYKDFVKNEKR